MACLNSCLKSSKMSLDKARDGEYTRINLLNLREREPCTKPNNLRQTKRRSCRTLRLHAALVSFLLSIVIGLLTKRKRSFLGLHAWHMTGKKGYILRFGFARLQDVRSLPSCLQGEKLSPAGQPDRQKSKL